MTHVVCLIADPEGAAIDRALMAEVERLFCARPRWLAEDEACEFPVAGAEVAALAERARTAVDGRAVDVCTVPAADRVKRLLVSDMDSTMITVECIDELADMLRIKAEVAAITRRAMNGELDFRAALESRVALLAGLPVAVFDEVYRERIRLMPGARTLAQTMRARGALTALVSGGFFPFVDRVRDAIGFDLAEANRLEARHGHLTGRVLEPIRSPASKRALLEQLARTHALAPTQTLAVGDGANDLPMLAAAGLAVAYRAHPRVKAAVSVAIDFGDLTALLHLQGIARREFVTA
jgi:phosphoserine phosphatase